MTGVLLEGGYARQFEQFRTVWRLQTRRDYSVDYESATLARFRAGEEPPPPEQVPWWRDSLARSEAWKADGRQMRRVCLDDPHDSDYQSWLRWAEPFHVKAGESILHMPRALAASLGVPGYDFLIFDDERLVLPLYDQAGKPGQRILIDRADSPDVVGQHLAWRDLAVANATSAVEAAA